MARRVAFNDTKEYNKTFASGFADDLRAVLESGRYILGDEVGHFEAKAAAYIGTKHCVSVSSGTTALEVAFRALQLQPDDEVILPANCYIACALGALASGAKLVPVDCNDDATLNIDMVEQAVTPRTRAVLVVHLYGDCCDMDRLVSVCNTRSLALVEDCAQSFGSTYRGKKLGSFGVISCHSFYPTKNLGSIGDAGGIFTDSDSIARWCRAHRNLGSAEKYKHDIIGTNARMDTLQAAFLARKLDDIDSFVSRKRATAAMFTAALGDLHLRSNNPDVYHTYHLYVLRVKDRDAFCKRMAALGIETIIHYPTPYYKNDPFKHLGLSFPMTEALADSIVSIPLHLCMSNEDIQYIIQSVRSS